MVSKIRFRDVALLVFGGILVGGLVALVVGVPTWRITHSNFATSTVLGVCVYGAWIIGYHRLSQRLPWTDLRTRFATVGKKAMVISALVGAGLVGFITSAVALLEWAGIRMDPIPTPDILPHDWIELPVAILVIVIVGPMTEELLFRGLLLDWLKQKLNVWATAVILSVMFSLLHANPFSLGAVGWLAFTHRLLLGLAASALAIHYRSLRPSLIMHGTVNAIACITSMIMVT
ncbi:MAG: CPBP family intramembrane metalloprotease [Pseudomonadota bacterium]|nr:CPBP family intramembrane metalloprotease [Pseudomonadota bacterium]